MVDSEKIVNVSSKIATLERRQDFLRRQLDNWRGSDGGRQYALAEISALDAAVLALRYHRADVEGLDTVVLSLEGLVDSLNGVAVSMPEPQRTNVERELQRAHLVLKEWD